MDRLPLELQLSIFLYLEPKDLDIVPQVCKSWRSACNEATWRGLFRSQFTQGHFTPISSPFSWRKEAVQRAQSLQMWNKAKLGNIMYRANTGSVRRSTINWQRNILLTVDISSTRYCAVNIPTGSWDRDSQSLWIHNYDTHPQCTYLSKYGILIGFHNSAEYSGLGVMTQTLITEGADGISCCWVSDTNKPTNRSTAITLALGTYDSKVLFYYGPQSQPIVGDVAAAFTDPELPFTRWSIGQINAVPDGFIVLCGDALFHFGDLELPPRCIARSVESVTVASSRWAILKCTSTLERLDLQILKVDASLACVPTLFTSDENLFCTYTEGQITMWSIENFEQPIWRLNDFSQEVTQIGLNPVVLVCGGSEAELDVYNVLTGEKLAPKAERVSERLINAERHANMFPAQRETVGIHVSPTVSPLLVTTIGPVISVYGKLTARPTSKSKRKIPVRKNDRGTTAVDTIDIEEELDYQQRRINMVNMGRANGLNEQEQLDLAIAISETTTPALTEEEELALAMHESAESSLNEQNQLRQALQDSLGNESMDDDEDLRRALELSLTDS